MIKHLYIKNFILFDELNLDFDSGFSVFTGETGAGKSILVDAISLLRAERANSSSVKKGKDRAIVEGTFDLSHDAHAKEALEEAGFDVSDETTFTREIHSNGKSVTRIDHRVVTLSLMREVLKNEIDIHGQRDTAYLLNTNTHIQLLDKYLKDEKELEATRNSFLVYDGLVKERDKALSDTYNENDLEYFRYQIQEIEEANLKEGEEEELLQKEKEYRSVKESYEKLNSIFSFYDDEFSDHFNELNRMIQNLKAEGKTEEIQTIANDSYYSFTDAIEQLRDRLDAFDMSEEEINQLEERLYTIQKLKRKYGRNIADILSQKETLESQVQLITHRQEYIEEMNTKVEAARKKYDVASSKLSNIRKKQSHALDEEIAQILNELMLPNARFYTSVEEREPSILGSDTVEFMISMNQGEDLKPLTKTASGGELSRLMLGLKVIFSRLQGIQTIIFDEIDTGVSGPVATAIGKKMHSLGEDCQVFSITHLAQVASCGDHHYFVSKSESDGSTVTSVSLLNQTQRIEQLALIASGEVTATSKKAAEELFKRNQKI